MRYRDYKRQGAKDFDPLGNPVKAFPFARNTFNYDQNLGAYIEGWELMAKNLNLEGKKPPMSLDEVSIHLTTFVRNFTPSSWKNSIGQVCPINGYQWFEVLAFKEFFKQHPELLD